MKHRYSKLWMVFFVLLAASLACNFSASTASVSEVYMSNDAEGNGSTTSFAQDEIFYCFVSLANAPDDTTLKAVWKVVDIEGEEAGMVLQELELVAGSGKHQFSLSNQNLWPNGVYGVDIYMNGEFQKTVEFRVD